MAKNEPPQPAPQPDPGPESKAQDPANAGTAADDATSPAIEAIDPRQVEVNKLTSTPNEDDARDPAPLPDPKDNPALPDDVSAIADPEDPMTIKDPGEDPDFGGRRGGTTATR